MHFVKQFFCRSSSSKYILQQVVAHAVIIRLRIRKTLNLEKGMRENTIQLLQDQKSEDHTIRVVVEDLGLETVT